MPYTGESLDIVLNQSYIPIKMLSFSRKTDYALIALAHLAGRGAQVASAREIGETYQLSVSLVANILKALAHRGIVRSARGVKGGYSLEGDLHTLSLHDLIDAVKATEADDCAKGGIVRGGERLFRNASEGSLPTEAPLLAVHTKLMRFLKEVKLADLVLPGHRIDVPVELVGRRQSGKQTIAATLAAN